MKKRYIFIVGIFILFIFVCLSATNPKKDDFYNYVLYRIKICQQLTEPEIQCFRSWIRESCIRKNFIIYSTMDFLIQDKSYKSYCFLNSYIFPKNLHFSKLSCSYEELEVLDKKSEANWEHLLLYFQKKSSTVSTLINTLSFSNVGTKPITDAINRKYKDVHSVDRYDSIDVKGFSLSQHQLNRIVDSLIKIYSKDTSKLLKTKLLDIKDNFEGTKNRIRVETQLYNNIVENQHNILMFSVIPYKKLYKID